MSNDRIHRALSDDGTEIAGRVHGHGPPLVFVHGSLDDGDTAWSALLPFLTERFTCHTISTRGRGLSADNPDHSRERLFEDVKAYAESLGAPAGLVGHSSGGGLVLGAAAQTTTVFAVAAFENATKDSPDVGAVFASLKQAYDEGTAADLVQALAEGAANDEERAALSASGALSAWETHVPRFVTEAFEFGAYRAPDVDSYQQITALVLFLMGAQSPLRQAFGDELANHLGEHVADLHVRDIPGVGHFAPQVVPEVVADELTRFFTTTLVRT